MGGRPLRRRPGGCRFIRRISDDRGFTLVEVLISILLITIVMTALTAMFVSSVAFTNKQQGRQMAIQLADDAVERVRALNGAKLVTGRTQSAVLAQQSSPAPGVAPHIVATQFATVYDNTAGATELLPTAPNVVPINGLSYSQYFYVGQCWQARGDTKCTSTSGAGRVPFYRVVIAVTWPQRQCANNTCSVVTSTLVSSVTDDPIFNENDPLNPPVITAPGNQASTQNRAIAPLNLLATGGTTPLTWTVTGLPTGLSASLGGVISGTPTAAVNTYTVTATVRDASNRTSTATFSWRVNGPPTVNVVPNQSSTVNSPVNSVTAAASNGTAPYTWSASGLPAGLSIDSVTGVISGTPTATGTSSSCRVTVTDSAGATANSANFTWVINPAVSISAVPRQNGNNVSIQMGNYVSGGSGGYTWSAQYLPPGITITTAGVVSGSYDVGTRYVTIMTARDSAGATASRTVLFESPAATGLRLNIPNNYLSSDTLAYNVGQSRTIPITAQGNSGTVTWSATGLPTGLSLSATTGTTVNIVGSTTVRGRVTATITARDAVNNTAVYMVEVVVP
ncbi:hypothetical protein Val02_77820 [Virgisporangium aliadipatigenens]|uniref:Prepilin-type N-terminal cleavage/methylation domain-containing protein n=1 Tax=Virgisporangium aliadipatigenens TaxID=741659 RepID=A0A8J3YSW1_9ACTN|nr:putative Ig domain-containing protein [Virgisporangium aliadipatigenens]GIJ50896.1 hypothetical protein Val02_77820 [Virgisporangium aliadipatigenens]